MAAEPPDPSLGVPPTQDTWSPFDNVTGSDEPEPHAPGRYAVSVLTLLVSLCGLPGNGAVLWLLGCRRKQMPFSRYVLRRVCTDLIVLLCSAVRSVLELSHHDTLVLDSVLAAWGYFYLWWLLWLMDDSIQLCVSVLWPRWHERHRDLLLGVYNTFYYGLVYGYIIWDRFYLAYAQQWDGSELFYDALLVALTLALCVPGLTLLVWVLHGPRRTRLTQGALTVLLYSLGYLLLGLPLSVCNIVAVASSYSLYSQELVSFFSLLRVLNSAVNPVVYFLVRRHGGQSSGAPQQEERRSALRDEERAEQRGNPDPRETNTTL